MCFFSSFVSLCLCFFFLDVHFVIWFALCRSFIQFSLLLRCLPFCHKYLFSGYICIYISVLWVWFFFFFFGWVLLAHFLWFNHSFFALTSFLWLDFSEFLVNSSLRFEIGCWVRCALLAFFSHCHGRRCRLLPCCYSCMDLRTRK